MVQRVITKCTISRSQGGNSASDRLNLRTQSTERKLDDRKNSGTYSEWSRRDSVTQNPAVRWETINTSNQDVFPLEIPQAKEPQRRGEG